MLFSKNLNVLALAIASSRAGNVDSLLAPADEASSSYKNNRERRRELLLARMKQRMDLTKAERAEDEAGVDPNAGADVGDLNFSEGEVEEIDREGRILKPDNENVCKNCVGLEACTDAFDENFIGCKSCRGDFACGNFGAFEAKYIGDHSCIGEAACANVIGDIGNSTCKGFRACFRDEQDEEDEDYPKYTNMEITVATIGNPAQKLKVT